MKHFVRVNGSEHEVELVPMPEPVPGGAPDELRVLVDGRELALGYREVDRLGQVLVTNGGASHALSIEGDAARVGVTVAGHFYDVEIEDERERAARAAERASTKGGGVLKSAMPGIVVEILVAVGERVTQGQPLLILEAMKMQNELLATCDGVVDAVFVARGQALAAGTKLVTIAAPPA